MKIKQIIGREIYDSRGYPTIECELVLSDNLRVRAASPSGMSRGSRESVELRDSKRLLGYGVSNAIRSLEEKIAPLLIGKEPSIVEMDLTMIEADETKNRSNFGANAMIAASMAVCRAQALINGLDLYDWIAYLCNYDSVSVPFPMFNVINGGMHAATGFSVQEIMLVPIGCKTLRASLESAIVIFSRLKKILENKGKCTAVGDEGGFAASFETIHEALDILTEAVGSDTGFAFAVDMAATTLFDQEKKVYFLNGKAYSTEEMIELYVNLVDTYPMYIIEDGLAETDHEGWQALTKAIGKKIQIIGDDLFVTNSHLIAHGIQNKLATGVVIKPNQIGTVTETLQAVKLAQEHNMSVIISHRSGDTCDSFIADLGVGTSATAIKAGGCSRGERMSKYNQLLRIEDDLLLSLMDM